MTKINGFPKSEKLCGKGTIDRLFAEGNRSVGLFPIRAIFLPYHSEQGGVQVLIAVSKRHFRHAVHRNRIKRMLREEFRLHSHSLRDRLEKSGKGLLLALIYTSDSIFTTPQLEKRMKQLLHKIEQQLSLDTQLDR